MIFKFTQDRKNRKVFLHIKDIKKRSEQSIRLAFYKIGKELTREARQTIILGPKTGRLYRIKGRRNQHRASAPGEPPANLTGNLQKSINFIVRGSSEMIFGAGSEDAPYARRLELGDDIISKRPYLIRAIDEKEKQTDRFFENELKRELLKL